MTAMALPALKQTFDAVQAVEADSRPRVAPLLRSAEVISFTIAKIIRCVDSVVEAHKSARITLIAASHSTAEALKNPEFEKIDDVDAAARLLAQMKWVHRLTSPLSKTNADTRASCERAIGILRDLQSKRPSDGRIGRKQAKRVEEAMNQLESQRRRFSTLAAQAIALFENHYREDRVFQHAFEAAIVDESIAQYPKINQYLAR